MFQYRIMKHNTWCHDVNIIQHHDYFLKLTFKKTIFSSWLCVNSKWNIVNIIYTRKYSNSSYSFWQTFYHFNCFTFMYVIPETDWYLHGRDLWFCLGIFTGLLCIWNYFDITRSNDGLRSLWIENIREINHNVSDKILYCFAILKMIVVSINHLHLDDVSFMYELLKGIYTHFLALTNRRKRNSSVRKPN